MLQRGAGFLGGLLTGLLASGLLLLLTSKPRGHPVELLPPPTPMPLHVHVTGAVRSPGVYEVPVGSIVERALQAAGGPAPSADLTTINLAASVQDGQQISVPSAPSAPAVAPLDVTPGEGVQNGLVQVNTASASELERLPGIGPALAKKIVEYRESFGPFSSVDDLLKVSGIGPAKLEAIRDQIVVP